MEKSFIYSSYEKKVIFIQGTGSGAYKEDNELVTSLEIELGTDYEVRYPQVSDEDDPDYEAWKSIIINEMTNSQGKLFIVAHSLGAYFLLKYLSEENPLKEPVGIFLIAPPYPDGDENWHFEGFSLPEVFGDKLPKPTTVFLYHSQDDEIVPFAHMNLYAKSISQATTRKTTGGHQLSNDLAIVAEDISKL